MKCLCNHCSTPLEFDREHVGELITCPTCNLETALYETTPEPPPVKPPQEPKLEPKARKSSRYVTFDDDLVMKNPLDIGSLFGAGTMVVFVTVLGWAMVSRGSVAWGGLGLIVVGLVSIVLSVMWILLPVIIYAHLDRQTKLLQYLVFLERKKNNEP